MGYMRHHAIVVTTWADRVQRAHDAATAIFSHDVVSAILPKAINGYCTFLVGPDGSKEGWDESDVGDADRDAFVSWLNAQRYEDGSSPYKWAEIQYGDDDDDNRLLRHDAEPG